MPYESLYKLSYKDKQKYMETYQSRFYSSDAERLNFSVGENPAFFLVSSDVYKMLLQIAETNTHVLKLCSKLPDAAIAQYTKKCMIDEIVLTNGIEGVHSTRKEVGDVLDVLEGQSEEKGKHMRFIGLINKYRKLSANEDIPLRTCEDLRKLYDEMFLDEVTADDPQNAPDGKIFRADMASVHSATGKVIHNGLYPEEKVIESMDCALAFLNNQDTSPIVRGCIFHYLLEYVHPFYDGNGRLGRFILSYYLARELEFPAAYRVSGIIKENINKYYKAFQICDSKRNLGDLTPFLLMQLEMIQISVAELEESLEQKLSKWEKYSRMIPSLPYANDGNMAGLYSCLIQAALFCESGIPLKVLEKGFGKSYGTVRKMVARVPESLLIVSTVGREKRYQIDLDKFENDVPD